MARAKLLPVDEFSQTSSSSVDASSSTSKKVSAREDQSKRQLDSQERPITSTCSERSRPEYVV